MPRFEISYALLKAQICLRWTSTHAFIFKITKIIWPFKYHELNFKLNFKWHRVLVICVELFEVLIIPHTTFVYFQSLIMHRVYSNWNNFLLLIFFFFFGFGNIRHLFYAVYKLLFRRIFVNELLFLNYDFSGNRFKLTVFRFINTKIVLLRNKVKLKRLKHCNIRSFLKETINAK